MGKKVNVVKKEVLTERDVMVRNAIELEQLFADKAKIDERMKVLKSDLIGWAVRNDTLFEGKRSFVIEKIKLQKKDTREFVANDTFNVLAFLNLYPKSVKLKFVNATMANIDLSRWGISEIIESGIECVKA